MKQPARAPGRLHRRATGARRGWNIVGPYRAGAVVLMQPSTLTSVGYQARQRRPHSG